MKLQTDSEKAAERKLQTLSQNAAERKLQTHSEKAAERKLHTDSENALERKLHTLSLKAAERLSNMFRMERPSRCIGSSFSAKRVRPTLRRRLEARPVKAELIDFIPAIIAFRRENWILKRT